MQRDETHAEQRILAQCEGLHCWLDQDDQRESPRARLRDVLGDRLFELVVGGLAPRCNSLAV